MADLKTTNIYGDAYINNKVGINTNTPATRLQIGQLSPTAATEGIQFGDDTSTRIYRGAAGQINFNGTINVLGNTYLGDANGDTVFVNDTIRIGATDSGDASLFFGEGAVAGSDYGARWYWDSGYTFTWYTRNAGTDTALFDYVTNDTSYLNWRRHFHMQNKEINYSSQVHFNAGTRFVGSNTQYLIFRSDSGTAGGIQVQDGSATTKGYTGYWDAAGGGILNNTGNWALRYNFGSSNSGGTLYGDWTVNGNISATNLSGTNTGDQTVGNGTITIAAGTGISVASNTFTTNQTGNSTVTVTNSGVTSNVAGTGISVSGATGAVTITNSGVTSLTGTANRVTVSAATGAVTLNLPQDIHTGASPTFSGLTVTGITMTNLTGAYQNTTVYDSPKTQSATPSRGIRAPASSIQFTDSYAIAPFWTYRSTGDWPVPYGIGWGTGGESSGIFQRYASNGYSFGDMIFYTGNDGYGAFSFRRHTWEGTTHFAAGSGELNTELFRIDWSGNLTMLGTLNGSANSATFYANNGSYGAWAINGTRNGWGGIEFANNGVSLMMGSDTVGFHQNTNGWLFRVHNGSGFIYKGSWGGGTAATIYDTTNGNGVLLRAAGGPGGYGDWNTFGNVTQTTNVITTEYFNLNGGSGNSNFPPVVSYTYGILANLGSGGDARAQVYISHAGNDLIFRGGWGTASWNTWNRVLTNINQPYAYAMNQYTRTTDTCSFAAVTATTFTGALSGNATTATTLQTARNINGVSFNGSAAITVDGLNYSVNNVWLRENGDDAQFQMYGNSRTMIYRTDGNTNPHGGGAYAHIFYYGGSADGNRVFIVNTDGRLWSPYHGWLDTMSISGNAATATSADNIDGRPFVNTNSNSATNADTINSNGISYYTGGVTNFSGNATDGALYSQAYSNDWQHQIAGDYRSGQIALRGKNNGTWQSWRRVLDETNSPYALNMNQYVRTTDNVTFGTVTATLSGTATNAGAINSDTGNVGGSRLQYWQTSGNTALNPDGEWYNAIRMGHGDPVTYYSNTLAVRMTGGNLGDIYTRTTTNGVTGSWNRFWHNNNDGAGSGLDADLLDGLAMHTGRNNEANKVVRTDSNGYIQAGWINTTSGDMPDTESINKIYCSGDDYVRYKGVADFKQQIGLTYKNSTPRSTSTTDTNYWTGMMGWGTTDFNTMVTWGSGFIDSWGSPGNSPGGGYTHFVGIQSIHYTNGDTDGTDNYGYQLVAGAGNTSPLYLRVNWGSAGSWRTMLDSSNYNSYAPSLTGNGASGTWSINVTGNAGTATTLQTARNINGTSFNGSAAITTATWGTARTITIGNTGKSVDGSAAVSWSLAEIGASGTTVNSGNTSASWYPIVWHSGNTLYSTANVQIYAAGGYIQANYFNSSDNDETGITRFLIKNGDAYHRSATTTTAADVIRGVASGNWSINVTGTAGSISGYNNPATGASASTIAYRDANADLTTRYFLANRTSAAAGQCGIQLQTGGSSKWWMYLRTSDDNVLAFYTSNATADDIVRMSSTGLGIKVDPSNRLHINGDNSNPAIRVDNGAINTAVTSNGRTFYGWLPISIAGTTRWIQLYNT